MDRLAETFERFDRKERHLLIRAALGHGDAPLRLSERFRRLVGEKIGNGACIPEEAWWATDYHFSWIAGALAVHEGAGPLDAVRPNPASRTGRRLVEGNQEDVDLVIAFGNQLILVEAKAYGAFSNGQMASKLARLELLHAYCREIAHDPERPIQLHLVLTSPTPPQKLTSVWPGGAYRGEGIPWIPLDLASDISVLQVTRCDGGGNSIASGECWRIVKTRAAWLSSDDPNHSGTCDGAEDMRPT